MYFYIVIRESYKLLEIVHFSARCVHDFWTQNFLLFSSECKENCLVIGRRKI